MTEQPKKSGDELLVYAIDIDDLDIGDEVMYKDPNEGSRVITIIRVEKHGPHLCIDTIEGEHIECFPSELS